MSAYGVMHDTFWDGPTGRQIQQFGGRAGELCAAYLLKNHDDNMIGLYALNLVVMRERVGTLKMPEIMHGMVACGRSGYADYDRGTGYVWVRELAHYRLNLAKGPLKKEDNRIVGAQKLYARAKDNPFLGPFFTRYRRELHLSKGRRFQGTADLLWSPSEAPSKPETDTRISNRTRDHQGDQKHRADARPTHALLVKLWHTVLDDSEAGLIPYTDFSSLHEEVKSRAAKAGLDYGAAEIGAAIVTAYDSALEQRKKRVPA